MLPPRYPDYTARRNAATQRYRDAVAACEAAGATFQWLDLRQATRTTISDIERAADELERAAGVAK